MYGYVIVLFSPLYHFLINQFISRDFNHFFSFSFFFFYFVFDFLSIFSSSSLFCFSFQFFLPLNNFISFHFNLHLFFVFFYFLVFAFKNIYIYIYIYMMKYVVHWINQTRNSDLDLWYFVWLLFIFTNFFRQRLFSEIFLSKSMWRKMICWWRGYCWTRKAGRELNQMYQVSLKIFLGFWKRRRILGSLSLKSA